MTRKHHHGKTQSTWSSVENRATMLVVLLSMYCCMENETIHSRLVSAFER